jgi:hypothetical protein
MDNPRRIASFGSTLAMAIMLRQQRSTPNLVREQR